ncbi:hypothetical protein [Bradyrhizobium diazoefficiens]|uniref:hypothetical protein n=1 Tax=Bradyrhizobium diazoefficiens TaxID=1355477 RepID=UPI0034801D73
MNNSNLRLLLDALRNFNDYITTNGGLNSQHLADQMRLERLIADRVMFNAGWHAARAIEVDELKGEASTDALAPILVNIAERARDYADAMESLARANAKLAPYQKPGRKKGSYKDWHFEPGYCVVVAAIETEPGKKPPAHVRWAVKEGWLKKDVPDKTHLRRVELIRKRLASEPCRATCGDGCQRCPVQATAETTKTSQIVFVPDARHKIGRRNCCGALSILPRVRSV